MVAADAHDISKIVKPGRNVVAIRATNQGGAAGLVARITINGPATKRSIVATDESWKVLDVTDVPKDDPIHSKYSAPASTTRRGRRRA